VKRKVPIIAAVAIALTGALRSLDGVRMAYYEFVSQETRRKWQWQKRYEKEAAFWKQVGIHAWMFALTVIYQIVIPIHPVLATVPPMALALLYADHPLRSGVALALYLTLPFKFLPLGEWGLLPAFLMA